MRRIAARARRLRARALVLVQRDADAFHAVIEARRRRDRAAPGERRHHERETRRALRRAAALPVALAGHAVALAGFAGELLEAGYRAAAGDAAVAGQLALAAAEGAVAVTRDNARAVDAHPAWAARQEAWAREQATRLGLLRRRIERPIIEREKIVGGRTKGGERVAKGKSMQKEKKKPKQKKK
jgi:formiminotetrahydrofolate cyclodeaminase